MVTLNMIAQYQYQKSYATCTYGTHTHTLTDTHTHTHTHTQSVYVPSIDLYMRHCDVWPHCTETIFGGEH